MRDAAAIGTQASSPDPDGGGGYAATQITVEDHDADERRACDGFRRPLVRLRGDVASSRCTAARQSRCEREDEREN